MGDYPQVMAWYEKALVIQEKVLGKEHPDTATTYHNIAIVFKELGENQKALEFFEKAMNIRYQKLGKNHPYIKSTFARNGKQTYLALGHNEQGILSSISPTYSQISPPPPTQED